jgi:hypothetical protein
MTSWLALLRMHSLSGRQEDLVAGLVAAAQVMDSHLNSAGAKAAGRVAVPQVSGSHRGRRLLLQPASLPGLACAPQHVPLLLSAPTSPPVMHGSSPLCSARSR